MTTSAQAATHECSHCAYYATRSDGAPTGLHRKAGTAAEVAAHAASHPTGDPLDMVIDLDHDDDAPLDLLDTHDSTCGTCHRTWSSIDTPTPGARCPFEYEHEYDEVIDDGVPEIDTHSDDDRTPDQLHTAIEDAIDANNHIEVWTAVDAIAVDLLDSVRLAIREHMTPLQADQVLSTVRDYYANHYGAL